MVPLLTFLREVGVVPAPQVNASPAETLLERYRSWMESERGLSASTVLRYENTARRFLAEQAMAGGVFAPEGLTGADLNAFLLRECARVSAGSAKGRVAELRSLMRFLHLHGVTAIKLGGAVPPVGGWRFASVPPAMTPGDVQRLLDCTPRQGPAGIRDYAILMLVARLGLRSIEVARLLLDDVDWRRGEIAVRGKGRREGRLPLPADVGEALVAYLSGARPEARSRHLFLTCKAPRGPIRADLVGDVVERACLRAGSPKVGPHRLRHALAADMQMGRIASDASFGSWREHALPAAQRAGLRCRRTAGPPRSCGDLGFRGPSGSDATMMRLVALRCVHHRCACWPCDASGCSWLRRVHHGGSGGRFAAGGSGAGVAAPGLGSVIATRR